MEIEVVGKEKDFEPKCGDIYKSSTSVYLLGYLWGEDFPYAYICIGSKSWANGSHKSEQKAFEDLDDPVIGKNYFPVDSTKLTIEYLG